jgi:hypothetical protein
LEGWPEDARLLSLYSEGFQFIFDDHLPSCEVVLVPFFLGRLKTLPEDPLESKPTLISPLTSSLLFTRSDFWKTRSLMLSIYGVAPLQPLFSEALVVVSVLS